jgi:hypothetical protein
LTDEKHFFGFVVIEVEADECAGIGGHEECGKRQVTV